MEFSRKALVAEAATAGHSNVSERLITDWVSLGLLDRAERGSHGKGKGRGAHYVWSERQRDLFLALLQQRENVRYVGGLASLPVSTWLYWGDDWIPLRQAKLALKTYWDRAGKVRSLERTEQNAWATVDALFGSSGSKEARLQVKKEIERGLRNGEFNVVVLTPLIDNLLESLPGGTYGPFRNSASDLVKFMQSFAVAMRHFDTFTDGDFLQVRAYTRELTVGYIKDQPRLSSDQNFGSWFEQPTYEMLVNNACRDLMRGLGMLFQARADNVQLPTVSLRKWTSPVIEFPGLPMK